MLAFLFYYLLAGFVLLLTRANYREWESCTEEIWRTYHPTRPRWAVGLVLALVFMVFWPGAIRITRK